MKLYFIGPSHIAKESILEIKKAFQEYAPDIVAVELDPRRTYALLHPHTKRLALSSIAKIGLKGYVFVLIGQYLQQKLGKIVGIAPGSEMKTALQLAQEQRKVIALIDQPIEITLRKLSFTWKEKWHFGMSLLKPLISPRQQVKELGLENFDLRKVPEKELISSLIKQLRKEYPSLYRTLIEERNRYMVRQLVKLLREHPEKKILVVVGAGHVEGMKELLLKVDMVR